MKKLFVLFAALALVCAMTVPAAAEQDWNFYGSARMTTFSETEADQPATDEEADTTWALQGNSRIGANVKGDVIDGRFEYGTGVNVRLLYGDWKADAFTLRIGQFYTPVNIFISNQVYGSDSDLLNVGGFYGGRQQAIQGTFAGGMFAVALVNPSTTAGTGDAALNTDTSLPKIEAAFNFKQDIWWITAQAGYNSIAIDTATDENLSINSMVYGVGGGVTFGPAYVNANVVGGTNWGSYGMWTDGVSTPDVSGGDVNDNKTVGAQLIVGFNANDMLSLEGGYGMISHELDVSGAKSDDTKCFYVQATINIAKGFSITPEVGQYDYSDDVEDGKMTYVGAKWQMNF
jgi:hypothetical protein